MIAGIGNSVAEVRSMRIPCSCCNGQGTVSSRSLLRAYVKGLCFSWRKRLVKAWKRDGYILCEECRGTGKVEMTY